MSYLLKWQSISFISRLVAMFLGIVQSIVIVNVLTTGNWGAVQVAASIASIIGVSQSLGSTSASTREISSSKTNQEAFKVFLSSLILRNLISAPFVIFLFVAAPFLAKNRTSDFNDVVWALRLISITLIIQTSQGIFNSVLSGFHKFKEIFIFQVLIAVVSVLLFIPLVYFYQFRGFYYAYFAFNLISALVLFFLSMRNFHKPYVLMSKKEFMTIAKEIFSISLGIYFVKLLYTLWAQGPILFLEYIQKQPELIPIFAFGLLYATKLSVFSDSLTDVTLPVMSKKFVEDIEDFKVTYKSNFAKTFLIITFFCTLAAFWNKEVISLVMKKDYFASISIIPLVILGVWAYSNADLLKSSIFVPAKKLKSMVIVFLLMPTFVLGLYYFFAMFTTNTLYNLALSFGVGTSLAFIISLFFVYKDFNLVLIDKLNLLFFIISMAFALNFYFFENTIVKIGLSIVYTLFALLLMEKNGSLQIIISKFVKKS